MISSLPFKSAIVRDTFNILLYALELRFNFLNAVSNNALLSLSILQYFSISFGVSSAFEKILYSLYLSSWIFRALFTLFLIY